MSAQQSWAAWLLDSYASSVSPSTEEASHSHEDETSPPTLSSTPSSSSPDFPTRRSMSLPSFESPYGPYSRTGRGGAGNFVWQSEIESRQKDIESQTPFGPSLGERRAAAAKLDHIDTTDAVERARKGQLHHPGVGRGGAGNYGQGSELTSSTRSSSNFSRSPISPAVRSSSGPVNFGRGGAGNFTVVPKASGRIESKKEREERLAAERKRAQIEEQVLNTIQPPPRCVARWGSEKFEHG